jgi:hypothetical protein
MIPGGNAAFPVDIEETRTVDHLKKEIKTEKKEEFNALDADALNLYKINVDGSNEDYIERVNRLALDLSSLKTLDPLKKLSKVFEGTSPPEETIHILVQPPKGVRGIYVCIRSMYASVDPLVSVNASLQKF